MGYYITTGICVIILIVWMNGSIKLAKAEKEMFEAKLNERYERYKKNHG